MATEQALFTSIFEKVTLKVTSPTARLMRLLFVAVIASFVFVGATHADILVSDSTKGTVNKYYDNGTINAPGFLMGAARPRAFNV